MQFPYSRPNIDDKDIKEVTKVLKNQYLSQGPAIKLFGSMLGMKLFIIKR